MKRAKIRNGQALHRITLGVSFVLISSLLLTGCLAQREGAGKTLSSMVSKFSDQEKKEEDTSGDDKVQEKREEAEDENQTENQDENSFFAQKADWIQSDGEWLYFVNALDDNHLYRCKKDGSELMKLGEDSLNQKEILLGDNQVFYIAYEQDFQAIIRINSDGSERMTVRGTLYSSEIEDINLKLEYYADGQIYYWYAPETIGTVGTLTADGKDGQEFGRFPQNMTINGEDLYYIDWDFTGDSSYSLWVRNLETEEETMLIPNISNDARVVSADDGHVYYTESNVLKSLDTQTLKAAEPEVALPIGTQKDLKMLDGNFYFKWSDDQYYAIKMSGKEDSLALGNEIAACDGDLYMKTSLTPYWSYIYARKKGSAETLPLFSTTGWVKDDGTWYFYDDGKMAMGGWKEIEGKSYYFSDYGDLFTATVTPDGHIVDENGVMVGSGYKQGKDPETSYFIDFDGLIQFTIKQRTLNSADEFLERFYTDTQFCSDISNILFDVEADWVPESHRYQGGIFHLGTTSGVALAIDTNKGTAYLD